MPSANLPNLDQLLGALTVARSGSVTRAASELGRSQSALSRQIQGLERRLRITLFDRRGRSVCLTPAGEQFIGRVGPLLEELGRMTADLGDTEQVRGGRLRLGITDDMAAYVLPPVLSAFRRTHKRIELDLTCASAAVLPTLVAGGEVDLAVTPQGVEQAQLEAHPLWDDELHLVLPRGHAGRSRSISSYAAESFILPPGTEPDRRRLDRALQKRGLDLRVSLEHTNLEVIKALVSVGLGLSLLPASCVRRETRSGDLSAWPLVDLELPRPIVALTDARRRPWPAEQALLDALADFGR